MDAMKSKGAAGSNSSLYRSICVNKATVNEETATINRVTLNLTGVTAIKNLNPYELQQAETMATCGGIEYENFSNIKTKTSINTLGNEASENMQVQMKAGSWIQLRNADFGTNGAAKFTLCAKGEGTIEIRLGTKTSTAAATLNISSNDMSDNVFEVDATKFQGVKNIYIVATAATDLYLDAWQFTEIDPTGIQTIESSKVGQTQRYDLLGRPITDTQQHRGIVIEQYTDEKGIRHTRKSW